MKKLTQKCLENYFVPCQVHGNHARLGREEKRDGSQGRARETRTGSATTTYAGICVPSCRLPTPLLRSPPPCPPRRRRLDFPGDGGLDDFLKAKCSGCVRPAFGCHPEPSNPRAFNTPSNQGAGTRLPVNASPQGAVTSTSVRLLCMSYTEGNASPQGAGTSTSVSLQGARSNGKWPICNCTAGKRRKLTVNVVDFCVCPTPKGQRPEPINAAAEEPPQTGNNNPRENNHLVNMGENDENGLVNPDQPEDDEWPFDIVDGDIVPKGCLPRAQPAVVAQESPGMLHQPIAMVELAETPTKSPMPLPTHGTASHVTPRSNCCFRCGEEGHWSNRCPTPPPPCYRCKEVGHRSWDCPKFSPQLDTCFHCGEVGHWKMCCPVLREKRGS